MAIGLKKFLRIPFVPMEVAHLTNNCHFIQESTYLLQPLWGDTKFSKACSQNSFM